MILLRSHGFGSVLSFVTTHIDHEIYHRDTEVAEIIAWCSRNDCRCEDVFEGLARQLSKMWRIIPSDDDAAIEFETKWL